MPFLGLGNAVSEPQKCRFQGLEMPLVLGQDANYSDKEANGQIYRELSSS